MEERKHRDDVSVGIITYNDCENIPELIRYFSGLRSQRYEIREILVVTTREVQDMRLALEPLLSKHKRLKCLYQEHRKGKTAAVNLFLEHARSRFLVLCSGDVCPSEDSLEKLVAPFDDERVGMTGGHIVSLSPQRSWMARADQVLWVLHHFLAVRLPKLGEMVVFRNIFPGLPPDISVDEAYIEHVIRSRGYQLRYVPEALVYNTSYTTLPGYVGKRLRICLGHKDLIRRYGYCVASNRYGAVRRAWLDTLLSLSAGDFLLLLFITGIEILVRGWACVFLFFKRPVFIWYLSETKRDVNVFGLVDMTVGKVAVRERS